MAALQLLFLGLQYGNSTPWPRHYCIASIIKSCGHFLLLLKENCQLHNLYGHVTTTMLVSKVRFKGRCCCHSKNCILVEMLFLTSLLWLCLLQRRSCGFLKYTCLCFLVTAMNVDTESWTQRLAPILAWQQWLVTAMTLTQNLEHLVCTRVGCLLPVHSYVL